MRKKLSWKAVRHGKVFCSPACGRGCTLEEKRNAERLALKLAASLADVDTDVKGGRWKISVRENLGWYFSVEKGAVSVYRNNGRSYSAYFNISGPWGGNIVMHDTSAPRVVKALLAAVQTQLKPMIKLAERLAA